MKAQKVIFITIGIALILLGTCMFVNAESNYPWHEIFLINSLRTRGQLTNIIKRLAHDGEICAIYDHAWNPSEPQNGIALPAGSTNEVFGTRHLVCQMCNKRSLTGEPK